MRGQWVLTVGIVILLVLVFFAPSYGWKLREFLNPGAVQRADVPSVIAENEALRAELAKLSSIAAQLPKAPSDYLRAMVYSRYPLNFKNEILVDAGENQGVSLGKAVVFQGILIGAVENVFPNSALVRTVFDTGFKTPVRIGASGYDTLFTGGSYPKAVSIEKSAQLKIGDIVYTAGPNFPYGLPLGLVASTSTSPDNLFQEAALSFSYDVNIIQTVLIQK